MSEISFNSIYDGVSLALHTAFPDVQVHGGEVKQGLIPGDLNVIMPGAGNTKEVGQRYRRTSTVDVIYYPKEGRAECYDIAHQLTLVLGSITTPQGDIIHARSMDWSVTDDVLHMIVGYDHFVYLQQEQDMMDTLTIKQEG